MKKTLFTICFAILCAASFAQTPGTQNSTTQNLTFGIRGGINIAKFNLSAVGGGSIISKGSQTFTTFNLGMFADYNLGYNFSFQGALYFTGKGGNFSYYDSGGSIFIDEHLYYLELPLDLVYYIPVQAGNFYLGAGPYFAMGLSGTINGGLSDSDGTTGSVSGSVKYGSSTDDNTSSLQTGLNLIAGFKLKNGLLIHLNYDIGLSNDIPEASSSNSGGTSNSRVFSISVGYAFK